MNKKIAYMRTASIYDDSRATKEIIALVQAGFSVIVIGWAKDEGAEEMCKKCLPTHNLELHLYRHYLEGGIGIKGLPFLVGYMKFAYSLLKVRRNEISIVHACDLDAGIPAHYFCTKFKKKLIYDIYDYYIDTHYVPFFLKDIVEKKEISCINDANVTIICTEERKAQITKAMPQKLVIIHNSPDIEDIDVSQDDKYDYAYCGVLSEGRLLREIIELYKENTEKRVAVAGSGNLIDMIKTADRQFSNLKYIGKLSYREVLEVEVKTKVLSAIYEPSIRNHQLCAPNKFYEALALGKPVIVCRGTGVDKIVEKENIGIVINYNAQDFFQALNTLLKDADKRILMGRNAKRLYEQRYKWSIMSKRLVDVYFEEIGEPK